MSELRAENDREILSLPISELAFSVRARKVMPKLDVCTIGDLTKTTAKALMACKNFGVVSLTEVREKLAERGLKLSGE